MLIIKKSDNTLLLQYETAAKLHLIIYGVMRYYGYGVIRLWGCGGDMGAMRVMRDMGVMGDMGVEGISGVLQKVTF